MQKLLEFAGVCFAWLYVPAIYGNELDKFEKKPVYDSAQLAMIFGEYEYLN